MKKRIQHPYTSLQRNITNTTKNKKHPTTTHYNSPFQTHRSKGHYLGHLKADSKILAIAYCKKDKGEIRVSKHDSYIKLLTLMLRYSNFTFMFLTATQSPTHILHCAP